MRRALLLLPFLFLFACKSSPQKMTMEELYQDSIRDLASQNGLGGLSPKVQERQKERLDVARSAWLEQRLTTGEDHLWCGAVLYASSDLEDLSLARKLALRAVDLGEPRGLPLSAEIGDKELLARGLPQKYGTQVVFDDFTRRYRMWDLDPGTTDSERRAVGLPTLEELLGRVEALDRGIGAKLRNEPAALPKSDQGGD
jgi:hypothetical protein